MKLNTNGFRIKCQHPLTLALAFFPLGWLFINGVDGLARYVYLFPAAYALLAWACLLIPGKWRLLAGFAGAAALAGLGAAALAHSGLHDYRATAGEGRLALILARYRPVEHLEAVAAAIGMDPVTLKARLD